MPRSRASARMSSSGRVPLLVTSSATPVSIAIRWASGRLPTTTTSPAVKPSGSDSVAIASTHTRPPTSCPGSPTSCSPSSTSAIAPTAVGASSRDASRDSRTYRRASARSVITPTSSPGSSMIGHQVDVAAGDDQTDLAHGLAVARERELLAHHVLDAQQHMLEQRRLRDVGLLEHPARLGVEIAEPHGHVLVVRVEPALELRVPDRGRDRVRVRAAVAGDVDARHAHIIARWA